MSARRAAAATTTIVSDDASAKSSRGQTQSAVDQSDVGGEVSDLESDGHVAKASTRAHKRPGSAVSQVSSAPSKAAANSKEAEDEQSVAESGGGSLTRQLQAVLARLHAEVADQFVDQKDEALQALERAQAEAMERAEERRELLQQQALQFASSRNKVVLMPPQPPPVIHIDQAESESDGNEGAASTGRFRQAAASDAESSKSSSDGDSFHEEITMRTAPDYDRDRELDLTMARAIVEDLLGKLRTDDRVQVLEDVGKFYTAKTVDVESDGRILELKENDLVADGELITNMCTSLDEETRQQEFQTFRTVQHYYRQLKFLVEKVEQKRAEKAAQAKPEKKAKQTPTFRMDVAMAEEARQRKLREKKRLAKLRKQLLAAKAVHSEGTEEQVENVREEIKPTDVLELISLMQDHSSQLEDDCERESHRFSAYQHAIQKLTEDKDYPLDEVTLSVLREMHGRSDRLFASRSTSSAKNSMMMAWENEDDTIWEEISRLRAETLVYQEHSEQMRELQETCERMRAQQTEKQNDPPPARPVVVRDPISRVISIVEIDNQRQSRPSLTSAQAIASVATQFNRPQRRDARDRFLKKDSMMPSLANTPGGGSVVSSRPPSARTFSRPQSAQPAQQASLLTHKLKVLPINAPHQPPSPWKKYMVFDREISEMFVDEFTKIQEESKQIEKLIAEFQHLETACSTSAEGLKDVANQLQALVEAARCQNIQNIISDDTDALLHKLHEVSTCCSEDDQYDQLVRQLKEEDQQATEQIAIAAKEAAELQEQVVEAHQRRERLRKEMHDRQLNVRRELNFQRKTLTEDARQSLLTIYSAQQNEAELISHVIPKPVKKKVQNPLVWLAEVTKPVSQAAPQDPRVSQELKNEGIKKLGGRDYEVDVKEIKEQVKKAGKKLMAKKKGSMDSTTSARSSVRPKAKGMTKRDTKASFEQDRSPAARQSIATSDGVAEDAVAGGPVSAQGSVDTVDNESSQMAENVGQAMQRACRDALRDQGLAEGQRMLREAFAERIAELESETLEAAGLSSTQEIDAMLTKMQESEKRPEVRRLREDVNTRLKRLDVVHRLWIEARGLLKEDGVDEQNRDKFTKVCDHALDILHGTAEPSATLEQALEVLRSKAEPSIDMESGNVSDQDSDVEVPDLDSDVDAPNRQIDVDVPHQDSDVDVPHQDIDVDDPHQDGDVDVGQVV